MSPKMLIRFLGSCTITSRSRCRPTTRASSLIAPQSPELLGSSGASDLHFSGPRKFDQTRSIGCPKDVPGNKPPGRPKGAKPWSMHSATREAAQQSPSNCRPEARDKELPTGTRRKRMSKPCQSSRTWIRFWLSHFLRGIPTVAHVLTYYLTDTLSQTYFDLLSDKYSDILPDIFSDVHILWPFSWQSFWHLVWHSIWHPILHSVWHFIWHIWHSIWHSIWNYLTSWHFVMGHVNHMAFFPAFELAFHLIFWSDILSCILSGLLFPFYLTFSNIFSHVSNISSGILMHILPTQGAGGPSPANLLGGWATPQKKGIGDDAPILRKHIWKKSVIRQATCEMIKAFIQGAQDHEWLTKNSTSYTCGKDS